MKTQQNMRQMVFVPNYHGDGEYLIGNSNTGRLHSIDCSAIDMMREDHKIPTDGAMHMEQSTKTFIKKT